MAGNAGGAGNSGVSVAEEMAAHDQLPKLTRVALCCAMLPWSSAKVLEKFRERNWRLDDPAADSKMAAEIRRIDAQRVASTGSRR